MFKQKKVTHRQWELLAAAAIESLEKRFLCTLAAAVSVPVAGSPDAVVVADLNQDGIPDLITGNGAGGGISIMLGKGNATYGPPAIVMPGSTAEAIAVADFNGDGVPDLVFADPTVDAVEVLPGLGNGSFGLKTGYSAGTSFGGIAVADVNNDGSPDILVTNPNSGTVSVLVNDTTGVFQAALTSPTGNTPNAIAVGNFDGEGICIATVDSANDKVTVQDGNGDGLFGTPTTLTTGSDPTDIIAGDFDGDGNLDLATSNYGSDTVSVFLGQGDGLFGSAITSFTQNAPRALATADMDGDGRLDLVVTFDANDGVAVMTGSGNGSFDVTGIYQAGVDPTSLVLADLNNDGMQDIAAANVSGDNVSVLTQLTDCTATLGVPASAVAGQPVTLSVSMQGVTLQTRIPTGTVTFMDGATTLGTVPLLAVGTATLQTSLPAGARQIDVLYNGDSTFAVTASGIQTVNVSGGPAGSAVTIQLKAGTSFSGTLAVFGGLSTALLETPSGNVLPYSATIVWGDGTKSAGTVKIKGNSVAVSGTHLYTTSGAYTFTVILSPAVVAVTPASSKKTASAKPAAVGDSASASTDASIVASASGSATIGQSSDPATRYAATIYEVLLGRFITAAELKSTVQELDDGLSRLDLVLRIESTPEFKSVELHTIFHQD